MVILSPHSPGPAVRSAPSAGRGVPHTGSPPAFCSPQSRAPPDSPPGKRTGPAAPSADGGPPGWAYAGRGSGCRRPSPPGWTGGEWSQPSAGAPSHPGRRSCLWPESRCSPG